jgi:DNA mismatch endonuclease (patch repair protein)
MTDVFSKEKRSFVMSRIRSTNTQPELLVRSYLHRNGYRFGLYNKSLPGKPDIVLNKYRTIIQVRGCFWHGHKCHVSHTPKSKKAYWNKKFIDNKARDKKNDRKLRDQGWSVFVIWECQCRNKKKFTNAINRVITHLQSLP